MSERATRTESPTNSFVPSAASRLRARRRAHAFSREVSEVSSAESVRSSVDLGGIAVSATRGGRKRGTPSEGGPAGAGSVERANAEELRARQEENTSSLPPEEQERTTDTDAAAELRAPARAALERSVTGLEVPWGGSERSSAAGSRRVTTVLRPGRPPRTFPAASSPLGRPDRSARAAVAPGGTPAVDNNAAANECTPSTASAVLAWNVTDAGTEWAVDVTSLTLAGQINIKPWPSDPTNMVVPNTANPVDGGNINNTAGSSNHWQAAIDDMSNYDTSGSGGAGPNWHSTEASKAHENAHWTGDYVGDAVTSAAGGNWSKTNTDLDALREPKSSSATEAAARTALTPKVNSRLGTWRTATITRWNALVATTDSAGKGGRGYAAGMAVLNGLITAVRNYATSKGWTGTGTGGGSGTGSGSGSSTAGTGGSTP